MKTLHTITIIIAACISGMAHSQVIIGDAVGTVPADKKASVLLEFANTNNKGILLPYVRVKNDAKTATKPSEGMIILDATNPADARVKYYNGVTDAMNTTGWVDLSGRGADIKNEVATQPDATQVKEKEDAMVIIGAKSSAVKDGVLILESSTRAMVLPQVDNISNIPSPSPGMMVFIRKEGFERLAVFNGSVWSFWQP